MMPMNPLTSFAFPMATAHRLLAAVITRDNLHLRPHLARKSVAARLKSGISVLKAFLRRLIILMALELEWGLVDKRKPMTRPKTRTSTPSIAGVTSLQYLDPQGISPWEKGTRPNFKPKVLTGYNGPVEIPMAKLYAQLDYLASIAANPLTKAKRLAFHLARAYHYDKKGRILPPQGPKRIAGYWGTEVSAIYDSFGGAIMTKSRNRPPPQPPPRKYGPSITLV
jgi:hypothetical protein